MGWVWETFHLVCQVSGNIPSARNPASGVTGMIVFDSEEILRFVAAVFSSLSVLTSHFVRLQRDDGMMTVNKVSV